jgi:hypothetical protein
MFQHVAQGNPQHKNHDFGIFYLKWGALIRYNVMNTLLIALISLFSNLISQNIT